MITLLRRWWWTHVSHKVTEIEVPGGLLSYQGPLSEAQVARIRDAFDAALNTSRRVP